MEKRHSFLGLFILGGLVLYLFYFPANAWIHFSLNKYFQKKLSPTILATYKDVESFFRSSTPSLIKDLEEKGKKVLTRKKEIHFLIHYDRDHHLMLSQIRNVNSKQVLRHLTQKVKTKILQGKEFTFLQAGNYLLFIFPSATQLDSPHGYLAIGTHQPSFFRAKMLLNQSLIGFLIFIFFIFILVLFITYKKMPRIHVSTELGNSNKEKTPKPFSNLELEELKITEEGKGIEPSEQKNKIEKPPILGQPRHHTQETMSTKILFPRDEKIDRLANRTPSPQGNKFYKPEYLASFDDQHVIRNFHQVYQDQLEIEKKSKEEKFKKKLEKARQSNENLPAFLSHSMKALKQNLHHHRAFIYWKHPKDNTLLENILEQDEETTKHYLPGNEDADSIMLNIGKEGKSLLRGESMVGEDENHFFITAPLFKKEKIKGAIRLELLKPAKYYKSDSLVLARLGKLIMEHLPKKQSLKVAS